MYLGFVLALLASLAPLCAIPLCRPTVAPPTYSMVRT